jgi:hypothetical protein
MEDTMTTRKFLAVLVVLLLVAGTTVFAEYDRDKVRQVMRDNVQLMGQASRAARSEDFVEAAQALMSLTNGMIEISAYTPPKGSGDDWARTMDEFIKAAFRGIGACGEEDSEKLDDALSELKKLNSQGHRNHR